MTAAILASLTPATAHRLAEDLRDWGAVAMVASVREMIASGLPHSRAAQVKAWVLRHGSADPRDLFRRDPVAVVPPRAPSATRTHLVIGDCHAAPGQDLRRFAWLGRMIRDLNPDVVISVGDWYSLDSLCAHRTLAERSQDNTADEVRAGEMALTALEGALGGWSGRKIITLGNHDDRLKQLADGAPWLRELHDIGEAHKRRGWEVVPYLQPARVDGILYQHFLTTKGSARAIGGKFHALRLLERTKFGESVVVGHSHHLQWRTESRPASRVHALVAGCYFEHIEDYAGEDNHEWWRGICVLRDVRAGDYDLETWTIDRIRERWGAE